MTGSSMPTDRLPEGDEKRAAVRTMFDTIAPRYDLVNRLMTFRLDVRVRRQTLEALRLPTNATVLDLACGTGDFMWAVEKKGHTAIGIDLSHGMMTAAPKSGRFVQGDLLDLPVADGSVDAAVCGYALRNLLELPPFFAELARVVKPGGRIALVDVSAPENPILRKGFDHPLQQDRALHRRTLLRQGCVRVSAAVRCLSPASGRDGGDVGRRRFRQRRAPSAHDGYRSASHRRPRLKPTATVPMCPRCISLSTQRLDAVPPTPMRSKRNSNDPGSVSSG